MEILKQTILLETEKQFCSDKMTNPPRIFNYSKFTEPKRERDKYTNTQIEERVFDSHLSVNVNIGKK